MTSDLLYVAGRRFSQITLVNNWQPQYNWVIIASDVRQAQSHYFFYQMTGMCSYFNFIDYIQFIYNHRAKVQVRFKAKIYSWLKII